MVYIHKLKKKKFQVLVESGQAFESEGGFASFLMIDLTIKFFISFAGRSRSTPHFHPILTFSTSTLHFASLMQVPRRSR